MSGQDWIVGALVVFALGCGTTRTQTDAGPECTRDSDCKAGEVCCATTDCTDAGYGQCPIVQGPTCLPATDAGGVALGGVCPLPRPDASALEAVVQLCDPSNGAARCGGEQCMTCYAAPGYAPYAGMCCRF